MFLIKPQKNKIVSSPFLGLIMPALCYKSYKIPQVSPVPISTPPFTCNSGSGPVRQKKPTGKHLTLVGIKVLIYNLKMFLKITERNTCPTVFNSHFLLVHLCKLINIHAHLSTYGHCFVHSQAEQICCVVLFNLQCHQ